MLSMLELGRRRRRTGARRGGVQKDYLFMLTNEMHMHLTLADTKGRRNWVTDLGADVTQKMKRRTGS